MAALVAPAVSQVSGPNISTSVQHPGAGATRAAPGARTRGLGDMDRTKPDTDMQSFMAWMQTTHKAPFPEPIANVQRRKVAEAVARQKADPSAAVARRPIERFPQQFGNIRVNQDRSPYPKTVVGVAINPADGGNFAVAGGGPFYVTTTNGRTWTEDQYPSLPVYEETDDVEYLAPAGYQSATGISFDRSGHTYTALAAQNFSSQAMETDVAIAIGQNKGLSVNNNPLLHQSSVCQLPLIRCDAAVETLGITTDTSGTATDGNTYITYVYFCNQPETCPDTLEIGQSAVVVDQITGEPTYGYGGDPPSDFGYASVVVDGSGQPHIIQVSYTDSPTLAVYVDQLYVNGPPLITFVDGTSKPDYGHYPLIQCAAHNKTAYCVFQATKVGTSPAQTRLNVYLATIDLIGGTATVSRVNNDALGTGKDHFDPSVAVTPNGEVYVGWFDNREDPAGIKLNYFVGKSTNGGKTFSIQKPVNDAAFDPDAVAFPGIPTGVVAAGPDGAVHAVWTDTRDGKGLEMWTQTLRF